jgi:hypothetical protein
MANETQVCFNSIFILTLAHFSNVGTIATLKLSETTHGRRRDFQGVAFIRGTRLQDVGS